MAAYATLADLANALPTAAYASVPVSVQQAALDARNAFADDKMRARYRLPLAAPIPASLVQNIVFLAAYDVLMYRGYNPAAAADVNIRDRATQALAWFDGVERQRIHPAVTEAAAPGTVEYDAPEVVSKPRQGWTGPGDDEVAGAYYASWTRRRY